MYVIIYRPVNQGEIWESFGPFYGDNGKADATAAAKQHYAEKGTRYHRPWVIVPVTPAGKLEYA